MDLEPTWKELMAIAIARDLKDTDRVTSGAHTEITFAATMLAQKLHAPNLKLQLGGTCFLCNVADIDDVELPLTSTDYRIIQYAEAYYDHPETFHMYGPPGGKRYYSDEGLLTSNKWWFADKFFVGGIQADRYGATNLIGLGTADNFKLRGPGTIGINDIAVTVREVYVFLTAHDKQRLVEEVDFTSFPSRRSCKELHFWGGGAKWIITPKAIFDFDPDEDVARLYRVFPGVSEQWVRENTGFDFALAPDFKSLPSPTAEEISTLRHEIDRKGVLRQ